MKIGLYGGTFDPIHFGHLLLATDALELLGLHRIHFLTASISPHKLHRSAAPASVRHAMVVAATQGEARFVADDREIHRQGPSFAIDSLEEIQRENPDASLHYFIGEDNVAELPTWRRYPELLKIATFVVFTRSGFAPAQGEPPALSRRIDLSSTEIRNRIAKGQSVRYYVPEAVEELIRQHHLYQATPYHR